MPIGLCIHLLPKRIFGIVEISKCQIGASTKCDFCNWVGQKICVCRGYWKLTFHFFSYKLYLIFPHLLYLHLCFTREGCCYDNSIFLLHGVSILEDLVITLADGIASIFLELISVDGNLSNEMNSLGLALCTLSTRALQRLRNEVVFVSLE